MLDATLVLQDVEDLLDTHYTELRAQMQRQVRVYESTPQPPVSQSSATRQPAPQPPAAPQKSNNSLNELVANVFVLLMLSVLNNGLSSQPSR